VKADSDPSFELPIGFAGGLADAATGLVRFGLRDYDPASGRFTARDPIFFSGSPTNLYAYANSDPASLRDPTGMWCIGGSFYSALGGGISYCRKNGQNSICAEGGVGVGGGVELDAFGDVAETGTTMQAEITQKYGVVSGTVGVELDLDCFNAKGSFKLGTATGHGVGVDTSGGFSHSFGGSGLEDFNGDGVRTKAGKFGLKTEGKLVLKGCGRF
jgi:RHS repeat-associated protein